jgi:signal transduction histidine kinase/ActR/RegA family two-component response regulator
VNLITHSGVPGLGDVAWGTHFCHFFETSADLADTLVPFFKTGLDNDEACLWVTSEPFSAAEACRELMAIVPDFAQRKADGQIEIIDHHEWYLRHGKQDPRATLDGWIERENTAARQGYKGLRLTGNTYWLDRGDWDSFMAYEELVNEAFRSRRIIGLCSYCLSRCTPQNVLDVVGTHAFALSRRNDRWQVVEGATLKLARQDLMQLQESQERLREVDRRKDEFLAMLAHELRNPLAPIRNGVELIALQAPEQQELVGVVQRQVDHLIRLVDDLLDVSRILRGRISLKRQPVDLAHVVREAVQATHHLLDAQSQRLFLSLPIDPVMVNADLIRIGQVVQNLISNASKYSQTGSRIELVLSDEAGYATLTVRDEGIGIEPTMLERIFEPFEQVERSLARSTGGLGIGLTLVQRLVTLHGGTVNARSAGLKRGSEFTVCLPTTSNTAPQPERPQPTEVPADCRVLIVDDNEAARRLLAMLLERLGCTDVRTASDAQAALHCLEGFQPDLILVDIGLPDIDGYELARRIRSRPESAHVTLAALTGYGLADDRRRSADAGLDVHLVKPASTDELLRLLEQVSRQRASHQANL